MKRPNNSNLIEENEQHKQKAQFLTLHKNYKEVIECYNKIAKNVKIERKIEKEVAAKRSLKSKLKRIKKTIKDLKTVSDSFNGILSKEKDFFFKDLQEYYYFFENVDINHDDHEEDGIFENLDNVEVDFEQFGSYNIVSYENKFDKLLALNDELVNPKKNCYSCKSVITLNDMKLVNLSIPEEHCLKVHMLSSIVVIVLK